MLIFVYLSIMLIALVCNVKIYMEVQNYIKERCAYVHISHDRW